MANAKPQMSPNLPEARQIFGRDPACSSFTTKQCKNSGRSQEDFKDCGSIKDDLGAEPIAVVGLSFKLPQESTSEETFWDLLLNGRCAKTPFPKTRLNTDAFYHDDPSRHYSFPVREGYFLEDDVSRFDAPFFSNTAAEAACMDPQQRGMLETTYHALENAGIPLDRCSGSDTSVYTGAFMEDYRSTLLRDPELEHRYAATGLALSMIANRISWFFNFKGASINLDSACSSSLSAVHMACQDLLSRRSSMAVVGGCNLIYDPDFIKVMANMNFLSKDSQCYSFDHRANGYARGEGLVVVILKRLSDAIGNGDTIRSVIRATDWNQDGRTPGITQPNGEAQRLLIQRMYRNAQLDMGLTTYVETHGTGTPVGDPIEAHAVGTAFQNQRVGSGPLYVGALKSNIGHLEGASGIAALVKTVLVLEKGIIPPIAGLQNINPRIDPTRLCLSFPTSSIVWPHDGIRRACITSFGFGGTNAAIVVDDASSFLQQHGRCGTRKNPIVNGFDSTSASHCSDRNYLGKDFNPFKKELLDQLDQQESDVGTLCLLIWSSADEEGIKRLRDSNKKYFQSHAESIDHCSFYDIVYTLISRRSALSWRCFALASSGADLKLFDWTCLSAIRSSAGRQLAYIFTGQGAQYKMMGRGLLVYSAFQSSINESDSILKSLGPSWSLLELLFIEGINCDFDLPHYSQPACTAVQIALIDLMKSVGIGPSAVIGHSSGEIAAAYCVGAISHRAALKVAYFRGLYASQLAREESSKLTMMSVGLPEHSIVPYLNRLRQEQGELMVEIGCFNSENNLTLTGSAEQIDILESWLKAESVFARRLRVSISYHSTYMKRVSEIYLSSLGELESGLPATYKAVMMSTVTGKPISKEELRRPHYWVKNMVSPVRFSQALSALLKNVGRQRKQLGSSIRDSLQITDLVELGPHSSLRAPVQETIRVCERVKTVQYIPTLVRNVPNVESLLSTLGRLFCLGYQVDLLAANRLSNRRRRLKHDLPKYQFNHSQSYWLESRISNAYRFREHGRHELLGVPSSDWNPLQAQWRHFISLDELPWTKDHQITGQYVYPASGMLVMAIEGMNQLSHYSKSIEGFQLKDISFSTALRIESGKSVETRLSISPLKHAKTQHTQWHEFTLFSLHENEWAECGRGCIAVQYKEAACPNGNSGFKEGMRKSAYQDMNEVESSSQKSSSSHELYGLMNAKGFTYGPSFQTVDNAVAGPNGRIIASVKTRQWASQGITNSSQTHVIHPTTLDGFFQLAFINLSELCQSMLPTMVPTHLQRLWISSSGLSELGSRPIRCLCRSHLVGYHGAKTSVLDLSAEDQPIRIAFEGLETTFISTANKGEGLTPLVRHLCCQIEWKADIGMMSHQEAMVHCKQSRSLSDPPLDFYRELSLAIRYFISDGLASIHNIGSLEIPPHLRRYIEWMHMQLGYVQARDFPVIQDDWPKLQESEDFRQQVMERVENFSNEGKFLVRVGKNIRQILRGDIDPLGLFFSGDLADDLDAYYQEMVANPNLFSPLDRYLDLLAHKNPSMNILEIGAGTGGATSSCLRALSKYKDGWPVQNWAKYDFTDISPSFFGHAQDKFRDHIGRMRFKTFDVMSYPGKQGFQQAEYDLIIASNVLHATQDLQLTLQHTRMLMKPGGKLVLVEITRPNLGRAGFAFGLLKGWWEAEKQAPNQWSPCLSEDQWDTRLKEAGFSGVDFSFPDWENEECHEGSVLVTSAETNSASDLPTQRWRLVVDQTSNDQLITAENLSRLISDSSGDLCETCNLAEAVAKADGQAYAYLVLTEMGDPILSATTSSTFAQLKPLLLSTEKLLWITRDKRGPISRPEFRAVRGLSRSLRSENPALKFVTLNIEAQSAPSQACEIIMKVLRNMDQVSIEEMEAEYEERDGVLFIDRVVEDQAMNHKVARHLLPKRREHLKLSQKHFLQLQQQSPGILENIDFHETEAPTLNGLEHEVVIRVRAMGISYRDYLITSGQLNDIRLGTECSGVVEHAGEDTGFNIGDRVCASNLFTFKTHVRCKSQTVFHIPPCMSFEEAASIPTAALLSYYSLVKVANLSREDSILIHEATSSIGQIAIQIALRKSCKVFVTAGTPEKREHLAEVFQIPREHIFDTRPSSFAHGIRSALPVEGVDVVLNSLTADGAVASWECVAPFGRFIDISLYSSSALSDLTLQYRESKNVSYTSIDLAEIITKRPSIISAIFKDVIPMFERGELRLPGPIKVYEAAKAIDAFRAFHNRSTIEKRIVSLNPKATVSAIITTRPSYSFSLDGSYVIAGGFGGLGRSIVRWMASRGAQHLILLSRSGGKSEQGQNLLRELKQSGLHVAAPACDVSEAHELHKTLKDIEGDFPPIRGCIQCSMVIRDSTFTNMTYEFWQAATRPKIQGSWNLHILLPKNLDFFILLSSVGGVLGAPAQSNYSTGNNYEDALACYRVARGQKAVSIDLGMMMSEGYVAESQHVVNFLKSVGFFMEISHDEFLALLNHYCDPKLELLDEATCQSIVGIEVPAVMRAQGFNIPHWMCRPLFRHHHQVTTGDVSDASSGLTSGHAGQTEYASVLRQAESQDVAAAEITKWFAQKLSRILGMPATEIDASKTIHAYGVDSLVAIELRNWFEREVGAEISVLELMSAGNISNLCQSASSKTRYRQS